MAALLPRLASGQTRLSGTVTDAGTKKPMGGVSIAIAGKTAGTLTNENGQFALSTSVPTPFTVVVSSVGYAATPIVITRSRSDLNVALAERVVVGQEVVVSASRVEESILQSPVAVEKMDIWTIQNTPSANFYDALANIKGVDLTTVSLTFKSVQVRGFGSAGGNVRVVQLTDGMDNQAPGLNFSVGNIGGTSELDLESVELLPGAASALYGPNAVNGILLMTSKSPFLYQGLSANVKTGVMHASNRTDATTPFVDAAIRYARSFNNKWAFKVNASYIKARDWQATDYRDQSFSNGTNLLTGTPKNQGYDGINVYGDGDATANLYSSLFGNGQPGTGANGTSPFLGAIATTPVFNGQTLPQLTGQTPQQLFNILIPNTQVARTGYRESDLIDYNTENLKLNGSLHYRLNNDVEAILQANWGTGTTINGGIDRYYLKGFSLGQYKAELRGSNFFVRAYTTQERSGDAYAIGTLAAGINEAWKGSASAWFPQFFGTYANTALTGFATTYLTALGGGQSPTTALGAAQTFVAGQQSTWLDQARAVADQGRLLPGSPEFQAALNTVVGRPIPGDFSTDPPRVGARFLDKTSLYHAEFMYNFNRQIDPTKLELIVGGNYRQYALNSSKTIFALDDAGNEFRINEFGGYVQAAKTLAKVLKFSGSMRYDKNQNFNGQFSPRLSAVVTVAKHHNFRVSYQRAFRFPTTQSQYIDLNTPNARLIGGLDFLRQRYNFDTNPVYTLESLQAFGGALQAGQTPAQAAAQLKPYVRAGYDPERVETYEVGYKSLIGNRLFVDAYYYYNRFLNFEGSQIVVQDKTPDRAGFPLSLLSGSTRMVYSFPANSPVLLQNVGWAVGLDYLLPGNFKLGGNVAYNALTNTNQLPDGYQTFFNTPRYRYNASVGSRNIRQTGIGFNVVVRHQEAFEFQTTFGSAASLSRRAQIIPAYTTLDAQVSKRIPSLKSVVKLGGSNLTAALYTQAWGYPSIGGLYYASLTFDQLSN
jgi:outer membrane receptor protein involved in Fe transport